MKLLIAGILSACLCQVAKLPEDCIDFGADDRAFGAITADDWRRWMPDFKSSTGLEHLALESGALRHRYEPSSQGSDRVVIRSALPPSRTYILRYSVLFEPGFAWGSRHQGGKLGFGFGAGARPSGGEIDPAGFTVRTMWRGTHLGGGVFDGTARLAIYSYQADRSGRFGLDHLMETFFIPIGEWIDVAFEVQANSSIDVSDGRLKAWINGDLMLDVGGIGWQLAGDVPMIDTLYYSSFYGGGSPEWAPPTTTYTQYRDVCWSKGASQ